MGSRSVSNRILLFSLVGVLCLLSSTLVFALSAEEGKRLLESMNVESFKKLIEENQTEPIVAMLDAGMKPNSPVDPNYPISSPIHLATKLQNEEMVGLFLSRGAHVDSITNARDIEATFLVDEATPLAIAILDRNVELVSYLLQRGANPNFAMKKFAPGEPGIFYPIHIAVIAANHDILRLLLRSGADPNTVAYTHLVKEYPNRVTALTLASARGDLRSAQILLSSGAHIAAGVAEGVPDPIRLAKKLHRSEILDLLEEVRDGLFEKEEL